MTDSLQSLSGDLTATFDRITDWPDNFNLKVWNWEKARISILIISMILFIWLIILYKEMLNFNNTVFDISAAIYVVHGI